MSLRMPILSGRAFCALAWSAPAPPPRPPREPAADWVVSPLPFRPPRSAFPCRVLGLPVSIDCGPSGRPRQESGRRTSPRPGAHAAALAAADSTSAGMSKGGEFRRNVMAALVAAIESSQVKPLVACKSTWTSMVRLSVRDSISSGCGAWMAGHWITVRVATTTTDRLLGLTRLTRPSVAMRHRRTPLRRFSNE